MEPWMPADALKACGQYLAEDDNSSEFIGAKMMLPDMFRSDRARIDADDFPSKGSVLWNR